MMRGEVVLVFYPFASGTGGSRRPALIVQSDTYNQRMRNTVVAQITTNLRHANDPASLLVTASSNEGKLAGLLHDSLVSCVNLATIADDRIDRRIGSLDAALMQKVNDCLKLSLSIS